MENLKKKAETLLSSNAKCKVTIFFDANNSLLFKNNPNGYLEEIHDAKGVEKNGILIGGVGHLQLIEWKFVKDIH